MNYLGLLHEILVYSASSIIIGVVLTLLLVVALFAIIKGCYPKSTFSPLSIITGVTLTFLLSYQMISMCGAIGLKGKCNELEAYVNSLIPVEAQMHPIPVEREASVEMIHEAIDEFPLMRYFVGDGWFEGYDTTNIAHAIAEELNSFLNQFIWKALFWSFVETLLAALIVVWTINRSKEVSYRMQAGKAGKDKARATGMKANGRSRATQGF